MRNNEAGQTFIIVLIVLAIGSMLVVPLLGLSSTAVKSSQMITNQAKALYAAEGVQEYIMWKLLHQNWAQSFTNPGEEGYVTIENCGITMEATVVMRAIPGEGGMTLATDHAIQPTKTVEPSWVPDKDLYDYTYTINLEQLSSDTSQGLDAIYDILPGGMNDYIGPTEISLDDGETWHIVPDPEWISSKDVLKWPSDYDKDTGTGAFSSDPGDLDHYFHGIRDFDVREKKMLRFTVRGRLDDNAVHCNWVVLKPWNTVSGPQAPIDVGDPPVWGLCDEDQYIGIVKIADPDFIIPGVPTVIRYDVDITNNYTQTRFIEKIIDYLPPGFYYAGPTEGLTDQDPQGTGSTININGVDRYKLEWAQEEFGGVDLSIAAGETLRLTFYAQATKDVSGSYYNEVSIILKETGISAGFEEAGVTPSEYADNYSWNQGSVTVPTYDSEVEGDGIILDENLSLVLGGISITSFRIR